MTTEINNGAPPVALTVDTPSLPVSPSPAQQAASRQLSIALQPTKDISNTPDAVGRLQVVEARLQGQIDQARQKLEALKQYQNKTGSNRHSLADVNRMDLARAERDLTEALNVGLQAQGYLRQLKTTPGLISKSLGQHDIVAIAELKLSAALSATDHHTSGVAASIEREISMGETVAQELRTELEGTITEAQQTLDQISTLLSRANGNEHSTLTNRQQQMLAVIKSAEARIKTLDALIGSNQPIAQGILSQLRDDVHVLKYEQVGNVQANNLLIAQDIKGREVAVALDQRDVQQVAARQAAFAESAQQQALEEAQREAIMNPPPESRATDRNMQLITQLRSHVSELEQRWEHRADHLLAKPFKAVGNWLNGRDPKQAFASGIEQMNNKIELLEQYVAKLNNPELSRHEREQTLQAANQMVSGILQQHRQLNGLIAQENHRTNSIAIAGLEAGATTANIVRDGAAIGVAGTVTTMTMNPGAGAKAGLGAGVTLNLLSRQASKVIGSEKATDDMLMHPLSSGLIAATSVVNPGGTLSGAAGVLTRAGTNIALGSGISALDDTLQGKPVDGKRAIQAGLLDAGFSEATRFGAQWLNASAGRQPVDVDIPASSRAGQGTTTIVPDDVTIGPTKPATVLEVEPFKANTPPRTAADQPNTSPFRVDTPLAKQSDTLLSASNKPVPVSSRTGLGSVEEATQQQRPLLDALNMRTAAVHQQQWQAFQVNQPDEAKQIDMLINGQATGPEVMAKATPTKPPLEVAREINAQRKLTEIQQQIKNGDSPEVIQQNINGFIQTAETSAIPEAAGANAMSGAAPQFTPEDVAFVRRHLGSLHRKDNMLNFIQAVFKLDDSQAKSLLQTAKVEEAGAMNKIISTLKQAEQNGTLTREAFKSSIEPELEKFPRFANNAARIFIDALAKSDAGGGTIPVGSARNRIEDFLWDSGYKVIENDRGQLDAVATRASNVTEHDTVFNALAERAGRRNTTIRVGVMESRIDSIHPGQRVNTTVTAPIPKAHLKLPSGSSIHAVHVAGIAASGTDQIKVDLMGPAGKFDELVGQGLRVMNFSISSDNPQFYADIAEFARENPHVLVTYAAHYIEPGANPLDQMMVRGFFQNIPNIVIVTSSNDDGRLLNVAKGTAAAGRDRTGFIADFAARGSGIRSFSLGQSYVGLSGTSQAAPLHQNTTAKMFILDPQLTVAESQKIIADTADKSIYWRDLVKSGGINNPDRAKRVAAITGLMREGLTAQQAVAQLKLKPGDETEQLIKIALTIYSPDR